eukprot:NODE_17650_length_932_cov_8.267081.p1 GENE.NODE_17650_length_932_cov_8.267081~~NODE_17650_length_932_cov_8.267081.p1  ORF type:complete len:181 (+),score=46.85 NODE_17650_length_932_cov_8.267081:172-714(+)
MSIPNVMVPPDVRYTAEVVVLLTSLGARRAECSAGKRAVDLLEIKRVHHKIIDFNRDARQALGGDAENRAIQRLMAKNRLQSGNEELVLPQIYIDGHLIGDAHDLQGFEDDRQLDAILSREACVACNRRREPASMQCPSCWVRYEEILKGVMSIEEKLLKIAQSYEDTLDDLDLDLLPSS